MPKVLITGSSTVGKTTLVTELATRGYVAIDGDNDPALVRIELKATGEPVAWPRGFVDWKTYSWNLQSTRLQDVLSQDETVFLAGIFGNQADFYQLFDYVIVLTVDPVEYQRRLDARPRRDVGDSDENMAERFRKYPILLQRFLDSGATPVDASGTTFDTADEILRVVGA